MTEAILYLRMRRVVQIKRDPRYSVCVVRSGQWPGAGAIMEDARGEMKVKEAVTIVAAHFFLFGHALGLRGSLGPEKSTCKLLGESMPLD